MSTSLFKVQQLQKSADLLLKAEKHSALWTQSHCKISPFFTVIDDSYNVVYYPQGNKYRGNCICQMNLTALQLKAFIRETLPDTEYLIDWTACIEWQFVNDKDETAHEHYLRVFPELENLTEELRQFFKEMPPIMHYIKSNN